MTGSLAFSMPLGLKIRKSKYSVYLKRTRLFYALPRYLSMWET